MAADHIETGRAGENAAAAAMERAGYRILERNYRQKGGELDIICTLGETIVFVEVRTRSASGLASPAETVNRAKILRIAKTASQYLSGAKAWDRPCRFDVMTVTRTASGYNVEHIEDAFDLSQAVGGRHSPWQPW